MAESAKDVASRGMESAKKTGRKAADKGHGTFLDVFVIRFCTSLKYILRRNERIGERYGLQRNGIG